jgi:tetratricopeptide (TPR) repeat protein
LINGTRKDPAAELRNALVAALVDVPVTQGLADRRLLLNLVRRDVRTFPDVPERDQVRPHVIEIVLACINTRGGLRALTEALTIMAPDAPSTRLASSLVESASLSSLLLKGESQQVRQLLRRAAAETNDPAWWREIAENTVADLPQPPSDLVQAFEIVAGRGAHQHGAATALSLAHRIAAGLDGPLRVELTTWVEQVAERLELLDDVTPAPRAADTVNASPGEPVRPSPAGPTSPDLLFPAPDDQLGGIGDENGDMDNLHETRARFIVDDGALTSGADAEAVPATGGDTSIEIGDDMAPVADRKLTHEKLPQVWGDVPQRNPGFTGREEFLEALHHELSERRQTAVLPQAIHGMGGVGKSQIAIEYVHRHSEEFDLVWWIPAEEPGQILTSLTKLAQRLKLDVSPEANAAVPAVQEALSTGATGYRDWLLVFDNAEDPTEARKYFPSGGAGRILVTSRNPDWERGTRALEVDVFTREESVAFLQNRNADLTGGDADSLAEALGDLPLAIEAASAWRATTGMNTADYLRLLNDKRLELFDVDPPPDYRVTVRAAWSMSLEKLAEVNVAALQLLQVSSFFAPEPISRDLFTGSSAADITPELDAMLEDTYSIGRAIRDILKLALAKYDHRNNALQIHRLIRLVLTDSMDAEQQKRMRRGAHTLLANAKPSEPGRRNQWWDQYGALRAHVDASGAVASADPRVHLLVFSVVKYLYYFGDHQGSEALAEQAFRYRTKDRGPADAHTLELAKWLGWMYFVNGRYQAAKELNIQTLEHYRESFGVDDEGTIDATLVVATDLRASGDFTAAWKLDKDAVETAQRTFGEEDPITMRGASNLGVDLRLLGRFSEAEQLDAETYQRRVKILGSDSDAAMLSLYNLLIDRRESGDYVVARKEHEGAYTRSVEIFGRDAPATLRMARALAVARRKAGDHPGALKLSSETFDRYQRRYGNDYPDTIATAQNLAVDRRHDGDLYGARKLGEDTLERYLRLFGARHVYTLSARTNLAVILRLQGAFDKALEHDQESLAILTETLSADHPVTLICATNYGSDLFAVGDVGKAYERDIDTVARSERALGPYHPSTLASSVNLALDLRAQDRVAEADRILSDTLSSLRRALGERHPATLNALQNLRADCDVDPMPL